MNSIKKNTEYNRGNTSSMIPPKIIENSLEELWRYTPITNVIVGWLKDDLTDLKILE